MDVASVATLLALGIAQPAHGEFERLVPGRLAERFAPVDAQ
ncbi:MAG: hypothetical protein M5U30_03755 [Burkholderiaceae bacterium]|nr:hypothetical protein [Burkholderiaceae bacterium]